MSAADHIQKARLFPSLTREPRFLGLPMRAALGVVVGIFLLVAIPGLTPWTFLGGCALYVLLLIPLRRVFERDERTLDVLPSLGRYRRRYDRWGRAGHLEVQERYLRSR